MTSRERVYDALEFRQLERIPNERDDALFSQLPYTYGKGKGSGKSFIKGSYTDAWGCVWTAGEDGVTGEVKVSPFADGYAGLQSFEPPFEVLREADLSKIDAFCAKTDKFVFTAWETSYNLFERMQNMRGTENLFVDIALEEPEVYLLRDKLHAYFMEQAKIWCETAIDALHISDDWGTQISLLINPEIWRREFKPYYQEYIDYCHSKGKKVIMHSDGYITSILPDLIEIGLDALNSQIFCMDLQENAKIMAGKLCYWGEIDRQHILPHGTPEDCKKAVHRVAEAFLPYGRTGMAGQVFDGKDISFDNRNAAYDAWWEV